MCIETHCTIECMYIYKRFTCQPIILTNKIPTIRYSEILLPKKLTDRALPDRCGRRTKDSIDDEVVDRGKLIEAREQVLPQT